jgi:ammonium transporter Rh
VQQYDRAIHIMAMLLIGFGFLMVFIKKYGRSALTATFLLVSISLPLYFLIHTSVLFGEAKSEIEELILAEFGAASLLIAAGAVLGRLKMFQYLILGLLFIPFYMLNEWIIIENGFGIIKDGFADTGGSIVIHAYGALFAVEIDSVLGYVDQIKQVAGTDQERQAGELRNVTRTDDRPNERGSKTADLVAEFPKKEDNYLKVKKIL